MQTFKRNVGQVQTNKLTNFHKYFNHFNFKGIVQDKNVFDIDQETFYDATNMYVDDERKLVSRPTLQNDKLPHFVQTYLDDSMHSGYLIVDMVNVSAGGVYVIVSPTLKYSFIFVKKDGTSSAALTLEGNITKYNISVIEQYVICFNNVDAKVIDTNKLVDGWQDFSNFVDIPVTKRVVGSTVTEPENNAFTESYKEEYIWSNESQPLLPEGNSADVKVLANNITYEYSLNNPNINTDYRILRRLNFVNENLEQQPIISETNGRICCAYNNYLKLSLNNGNSFKNVYYPAYNGEYLGITAITEDGLNILLVTTYGVYIYEIDNDKWIDPILYTSNIIGDTGMQNIWNFKSKSVFAFITNKYDTTLDLFQSRLYVCGVGKHLSTDQLSEFDITDNRTQPVTWLNIYSHNKNMNNKRLFIKTFYNTFNNTADNELVTNVILNFNINGAEQMFYIMSGELAEDNNDIYCKILSINTQSDNLVNSYIYDITQTNSDTIWAQNIYMVALDKISSTTAGVTYNWKLYSGYNEYPAGTQITFTSSDIVIVYIRPLDELDYEDKFAYKLAGGFIWMDKTYSNFTGEWLEADLPEKIDNEDVTYSKVINTEGDKFYILANNSIYTNNLDNDDIATITYLYESDSDVYNKVPDVSYSDTELYLAFGNTLKITQNDRDGVDIKFNLPKINDQTFIDNITGMINISTTEVALFFKDKIVICSKVQDENIEAGYRYDYYNTKLSVGIRKGDSVINTLEGSYTIFPTQRGLAIMNYQAFMATTDQVVEYITDDIKEIWTAFYDASTKIHIMQWRNRLMLTNEHKQILVYDLTGKAWWKWEVPIDIFNLFTDQLHLRGIYKTQLIFKESPNYYDFGESGHPITIDYSLMSQPLHMNGSNYYKNIKQLVFQFGTDDEESAEKKRTIVAQIKLYRKKVTIREPEQVQFKIDELRTFVKRFNYWKINELQWALSNDVDTVSPTKLELNGITIKYEYGEEVR